MTSISARLRRVMRCAGEIRASGMAQPCQNLIEFQCVILELAGLCFFCDPCLICGNTAPIITGRELSRTEQHQRLTMSYAIYQPNGPIYGCGYSRAAAKTDAAKWLSDPETGMQGTTTDVVDEFLANDEINIALCSDELEAAVDDNGGDVRYEMVDGQLELA